MRILRSLYNHLMLRALSEALLLVEHNLCGYSRSIISEDIYESLSPVTTLSIGVSIRTF